MRKLFLFIFVFIFSISLYAQSEETNNTENTLVTPDDLTLEPEPLFENETENEVPREKKERNNLFFRAYIGEGSFVGFGIDYYIADLFWVGFAEGFSFKRFSDSTPMVYSLAQNLYAGFYVSGNKRDDFRLGASVSWILYINFLGEGGGWAGDTFDNSVSFYPTFYLVGEYDMFFAKIGVAFDNTQVPDTFPVASVGIKF